MRKMTKEKEINPIFKLEDIPLNKWKLFEIEGDKFAAINDNGEYLFYKLKPIGLEKPSE